MSIRKPLKTVAQFTDANDTGTGSVAGGIQHTFTLPQDTDNVVVKVTASVAGTGVSAVLQTTDDGGTTYYDVARTSIVSNANGTIAEWLAAGTISDGVRIGSAAASSLGAESASGLPILSERGRIFIIINGNVTSAASNEVVSTVLVNSQSASSN